LSRYAAPGIVECVRFRRPPSTGNELGQASAELLGVVPAVLLVAALVWQLALAGQAAWLCANAARAAARAEAVGRDGPAAARSALPRSLERGLRVETASDGVVRVRMRIPLLLRSWQSPLSVAATARLGEGA
jgi:pilus assembly protein CpaE